MAAQFPGEVYAELTQLKSFVPDPGNIITFKSSQSEGFLSHLTGDMYQFHLTTLYKNVPYAGPMTLEVITNEMGATQHIELSNGGKTYEPSPWLAELAKTKAIRTVYNWLVSPRRSA